MRRFLLYFLLCLMPLQFSWAAMTDYYAHPQDLPAQHFGHQDEQHEMSSDVHLDEKQSASDLNHHDHCHLWGFLGIPSACTLTVYDFSQSLQRGADSSYHTLISDQLERPNWSILV